MTDAEARLLIDLAHPTPTARTSGPTEVVDATVLDVIERRDPDPAYLTGRTWDVLAANKSARLLWTDWPTLPAPERNMLWFVLVDPAARLRFVDWESHARALLGRFRVAHSRNRGDRQFDDTLERILAASPEAREWWPLHEVTPIGGGSKRMRHPDLGDLHLQHTVLTVADQPDQRLVLFGLPKDVRAEMESAIELL